MNEIDWLAARRPEPAEPDDGSTHAARTALLAHAEGRTDAPAFAQTAPASAQIAPESAASAPAPSKAPRRRLGMPRVLVAAGVVAAAGLAVAGVLPGGDGATGPIGAPPEAEAAPLVRLAARISTQPAPAVGDATLVTRTTKADGEEVTVYDLLRDDGRYAFGRTPAALAQAASGDGDDGGRMARILAAVAAATRLPAEQARVGMLAADQVDVDEIQVDTAAERREVVDNAVWGLSIDALQMGAGRPQIREGVMRLLATLPEVTVRERGATLEIANRDFSVAAASGDYTETLTVDAATGMLRRVTTASTPAPGTGGQPTTGVVEYVVRRVEADELR